MKIYNTVKTLTRAKEIITDSVSGQDLNVNDGFFNKRSAQCECGETQTVHWRGFNKTQDVLHDVEVAVCQSCGDNDATGIEVIKSTII